MCTIHAPSHTEIFLSKHTRQEGEGGREGEREGEKEIKSSFLSCDNSSAHVFPSEGCLNCENMSFL